MANPNPEEFLSIQAQDFIEDVSMRAVVSAAARFLSIQAQDFIEEHQYDTMRQVGVIPEHSSSGLH